MNIDVNNKEGLAKNRLTTNERILLHLLDNFKVKNSREAPEAITQRGIADAVQIRWNHVPRAMTKLKNEGLVFERLSHIEKKTRRQKAYYLTDEGMFSARNLRERVLGWGVYLKKLDGQIVKMRLNEVNSTLKTNFSPLKLSINISEENIIDAKELLQAPEMKARKREPKTFLVSGEITWPKEFVGRDSEVSTLQGWIDGSEFRTVVIYGSIGIGKSALMAEVIQTYKNKKNIFWYQLSDEDSRGALLSRLSEFLSELRKTDLSSKLKEHSTSELKDIINIIHKGLKGSDAILAFDNYYMVSEEIQDFFASLSNLAVGSESFKVIITAMDTTPFYCRFYDKKDIKKNKIAEMTLKGLDMEGTKHLLEAPKIDHDALRKIHLMTRGHPLTIELIKKGDVNNLKRIKGFSRQEASLLLYLKSVESK